MTRSAFKQAGLAIFLTCILSSSSDAEPPGDLEKIVRSNNRFAIDLYSVLRKEDGNLFFSPYSISTALAMTYCGARGKTAEEMAGTLQFTLGRDKIPAAFGELEAKLNDIQKVGDVQLCVANSLWPQKDYPFRQDYLTLMKQNFGVSITPVDYLHAREEARRTINEWVEIKTKERIKKLIRKGDLDIETVLVLVNAIYFKGNWAGRFDPQLTEEDDFILADGKKKKVPLMVQKGTFGFRELKDVQILELPYAGRQLSMFVILPREDDGLKKIEDAISEDNLRSWLSFLPEKEVRVYLPKFKITWGTFELNEPLMDLGIKDAFSPAQADFTGMAEVRELYISLVLHKAFVEVNEEGTEAAAAAAVVMSKEIARRRVFRADHPFLFLIRDNTTGSILFLGRVIDPTVK